jgi:hypothetical protein
MKIFALAILMLFNFTLAAAQSEPLILMTTRREGPPEPRLEAIALIDNGQFKTPAGVNNKDGVAFIKKYLPVGKEFFVVFGGGAAGTIKLTENGLGCNGRIYAIGPFNPGALGISRIRGQVHGLAINSDRVARSEIWRRAPSAAERLAAVDLAKSVFASQGLTRAQLAKMETVNLTAIDVDADNRAELVGTFMLRSPDPNRSPRYVFLIAEDEGPGSKSYKTTFSSYRAFPNSEVFNIGEETLLDYLELDRDGVAEIVTSYSTERAAGYHIYRRGNGAWKLIYDYATPWCD